MNWLRKKIGWIAGITVGVMILWLVGTAVSIRASGAESAGTLFGKPVPMDRYAKALAAVTHQAIFSYGDNYRQKVSQEQMDQTAWERLILLAEARRQGVRTSDRQVIQFIQSQPVFQAGGRFDPRSYQALVEYSLGTTPRTFEEETRENLNIEKMFQRVMQVEVSDQEVRETFRKREEAAKQPFNEIKFGELKESLRRELLEQKRLNAYFAWYADLLKRAHVTKRTVLPATKAAKNPHPPKKK